MWRGEVFGPRLRIRKNSCQKLFSGSALNQTYICYATSYRNDSNWSSMERNHSMIGEKLGWHKLASGWLRLYFDISWKPVLYLFFPTCLHGSYTWHSLFGWRDKDCTWFANTTGTLWFRAWLLGRCALNTSTIASNSTFLRGSQSTHWRQY